MSDARPRLGRHGEPREPLPERLPRYAAVFGVGLAAALIGGLLLSLVADLAIIDGIGWCLLVVGIGLLLSGGMNGGGYVAASSGDYGILYGRHSDHGQYSTDGEILRYRDLRNRLASGLRPGRNPTAFWQVVAGLAYLAAGALLLGGAG